MSTRQLQESIDKRNAAVMALEADFREALEILRSVEFTTAVVAKCPVCLGFEAKGNGETSRHHNAKCRLNALLKRHP